MNAMSAEVAIRSLSKDALAVAVANPSGFARQHQIDVSDAIPLIRRETALRKSHKIWRK